MIGIDVNALLTDRWVLLGGVVLALLVLVWIAARIRRFAKSPLARIASVLANLFMVVGLGWSSEAIWEITYNKLKLPLPLVLLLFLVFEIALVLSMIRAAEHRKVYGWPGRPGRTTWIIASVMSVVAASAADSFAEVLIRGAIPLVVALLWWDGLVAGAVKRSTGSSSWRWTPRRLLLWLGAIEPGERDVESVHRERLTQQMTKLYFKVEHGSKRFTERRKARLMRLSLAADDAITADVLERVERATWFEPKQPAPAGQATKPGIPASQAVSQRARRVIHNRRLRTLRVKQPQRVVPAVQVAEPDPRSKQEIESAIRFIKAGSPDLSQRDTAHLVRTSPANVNRVLRRKQNPSPPPTVNGRQPELEGVDR